MIAVPPLVVWHDVECGSYRADLTLWHALAREETGPVLDVGAGTGRVALELARAGHDVWALDREPAVLEELGRRASAAGLEVRAVLADATSFALGVAFGLILVPMQTIQLLPERHGFLTAAARHLASGGLVAVALTTELEGFDPGSPEELPPPDVAERDGWRFVSQPLAVRELARVARIERRRELIAPDGTREVADDVVELARVAPGELEAEARAAGLAPAGRRAIAATEEHVGSEVVLLRG